MNSGAVEIKRPLIVLVILSWAASPFWLFCVDMYPALTAFSLPWSTTAVAIFMAIWFVILIPTLDMRAFCHALKHPAYWLPLAFFALAVVGMFWAGSPWDVRLHGIGPVIKLLVIPFL